MEQQRMERNSESAKYLDERTPTRCANEREAEKTKRAEFDMCGEIMELKDKGGGD